MSNLNLDDHDNAKMHEEMDELFLRHMMRRYMQKCGEQAVEEEKNLPELPYSQPTKAQYRRMKRDLKRAARQSGLQVRRVPKQAVPLIVVLIALLTACLVTANAFRVRIFNFFNVSNPVSSEYGSRDVSGRKYSLDYVPEGYVERSYDVSSDAVQIFYTDAANKDEYFLLFICENSRQINADTENAEYIEPIKIAGKSGEISCKDGLSSISWSDSDTGTVYLLQTTLGREEVISVAEGLRKN